jgi:hypothetical protein
VNSVAGLVKEKRLPEKGNKMCNNTSLAADKCHGLSRGKILKMQASPA